MKAFIAPGKYIVAVSGGVDSVVLLDILTKNKKLALIVAHYNHGIRPDSNLDEELVKKLAHKHQLPFEVGYGNLGKNVSEQIARQKRYEFLESLKQKYNAKSIITAHHEDDMIETAYINIIRGTGFRGLSAISTNPKVLRPLLKVPKTELVDYAKKNKLAWREDATNDDMQYLRNYLRKNILPALNQEKRHKLINQLEKVKENRSQTDKLIATISHNIMLKGEINRSRFAQLPSDVGNELVVFWLRDLSLRDFDRKTIIRLSNILKTGLAGTRHNIQNKIWLTLNAKNAHFTTEE